MRLRFYLSPESTTTHDFLVVRTGFEPVSAPEFTRAVVTNYTT